MRVAFHLLALILLLGASLGASSSTPLLVTDPPDDADGLSCPSTGVCGSVSDTAANWVPVNVAHADIVHVRANSRWKTSRGVRTVTGIEVRMHLSAQPQLVAGKGATSAPIAYVSQLRAGDCTVQVTTVPLAGPTPPAGVEVWLGTGCPTTGAHRGAFATHRWDASTRELVVTLDLRSAPKQVRAVLPVGAPVRGVSARTQTLVPAYLVYGAYLDYAWAPTPAPVWHVGADAPGKRVQGY